MRFDGERWRNLPPVPVGMHEVVPDGVEHPADERLVDDAPSREGDG